MKTDLLESSFVFGPEGGREFGALDRRGMENAFCVIGAVNEDGVTDDKDDGALGFGSGFGVDLNGFLGASFDEEFRAVDGADGAVDVVLDVGSVGFSLSGGAIGLRSSCKGLRANDA